MMQKETVISTIKNSGLLAIVRAPDPDQAAAIAEACIEGGITAVEITFSVPGAAESIQSLSKKYGGSKIAIGAGTVLDPQTARIALLSGASYIVSPCLNRATIELCNRYRVPCMPGAMTVKEVVECMEAGADIIKIFPGEVAGIAFVKALKGPLPQAQVMPTGGVDLDNVADWIKAGAVAVGVGGNLTSAARGGDFSAVARTAAAFLERIRSARTHRSE